jgi:heterodisulfide reductase subunit C
VFEWDLSPLVWKINWWLHTSVILGFLWLVPRSKHLHLVLAPVNIFFKPFILPDHTPVEIDLEASEEELDNMLASLTKMTMNQALDVFSCVECGRCTEVCPANRGGGILDPKNHFMLDLRDPLMETGDVDVLAKLNVEAGWECTTCQACTDVCPVGNNVEKSDEIRRLEVLVEGKVPQEYQKLLNNFWYSWGTFPSTNTSNRRISSDFSTLFPTGQTSVHAWQVVHSHPASTLSFANTSTSPVSIRGSRRSSIKWFLGSNIPPPRFAGQTSVHLPHSTQEKTSNA